MCVCVVYSKKEFKMGFYPVCGWIPFLGPNPKLPLSDLRRDMGNGKFLPIEITIYLFTITGFNQMFGMKIWSELSFAS